MGNEVEKALSTIVWYNGLTEAVSFWKRLPREEYEGWKRIASPFKDPKYRKKYTPSELSELEIFWMLLVLLFGDYEKSPCTGWIEDISGFNIFIDKLTDLIKKE